MTCSQSPVGTVTKKTAGFPGFDHFRFRQQDASFSYWRVNILYSMEPATIAVVLVTSVLLYDAVLYGCAVQQHCSMAVRRTEVQYIGRQCVRTVNYAKYVTARNLIGPCRAPQLSTNFYRFKPISALSAMPFPFSMLVWERWVFAKAAVTIWVFCARPIRLSD